MDFFEEVDALGVVENHIQEVLKLEEKEARALLRRYREIRGELRDRLDRFRAEQFSAQQLRGVLTQIDAAIMAMGASLKDGMKDSAFKLAIKGVDDQLKEIRFFEKEFVERPLRGAVVPINLNVNILAQDTSNFLINQYEASINAYSEDLRANLVQTLTTESLLETPYSQIVQRMGAFFQGEEWKLHRIARTELHNIYGLSKVNGMIEVRDSTLPDLMKTLIHPMDARTAEDSKFVDKLRLIVPLNEEFRYKWKGKVRSYFNPPDRPNDRSVVVPYRKEWDSRK